MMIFFLTGCKGIPPYDDVEKEQTARMDNNFIHFQHTIDDQILHGVRTGLVSEPAVIFIHGAPGNWKAWGEYLGDKELTSRSAMIAIDRPGYAGSGSGIPELSLKKQASTILRAALLEHPGPFLLVGHSYGGPVQLQMALDFPEHVSGMILLAGAIDPVIQKSRWYHHLAATWAGRMILPRDLNVTTKEMLSLPDELIEQKKAISSIDTPITLIQGQKDWLVPPGNANYAKEHLKQADLDIILLPKQGHFLPWQEYDLVKNHINEHLERTNTIN